MIAGKEIARVLFERNAHTLYIERGDDGPWTFTREDAREIRTFVDAFLGEAPEIKPRAPLRAVEQELLSAALDHARAGEPERVIALVEAIEAVRRL